LREQESKVLVLIMDNPRITQDEIAEKLLIGRKLVQKSIHILKQSGVIVRIGGKRYGYWEVHPINKI
jgi:ATP-dependent DNA helicase RecG